MPFFNDKEFANRFLAAMAGIAQEPRMDYALLMEEGPVSSEPRLRASGLGSCARQQFFGLVGDEPTDPGNPVYNWSTYMGYAGQEYVAAVLRRMGYELTLPGRGDWEGLVSYLPDGTLDGLDMEEPTLWDAKVRNVYAYKMLVTRPMRAHDPQMYLQMQVYMAAEKLKKCVVTVHPHDLSTTRNDMARYKWGEQVVTPVVHRLFVSADTKAQQLAHDRASAIMAARELSMVPMREYNPHSVAHMKFPCGFCPYVAKCLAVDAEYEGREAELMLVPPIPEEWSE